MHALDSRPCVTLYVELSIALCVFHMYLYPVFTYVPIFKEGLVFIYSFICELDIFSELQCIADAK